MNISASVRYLHKLTDGYQQAQIAFTEAVEAIVACTPHVT